jgi:dihydroorotate dehydrogenase (fumarate)
MTDYTTHYLGLALRNPLVASASPLTADLDGVRALADAGIGAMVLPSLFEEEIHRQELQDVRLSELTDHHVGEATSYFPSVASHEPGQAKRYLMHLERAVAAVDVPVMASLNGSTRGGWTHYARAIEQAGAAAIELNVHPEPVDLHIAGRVVEDEYVEIVQAVKESVDIPVAVKLSPWFSSVGEMALRLDRAGADGLVLFNRFLHPDVDPERLTVEPSVALSSPVEARMPRAWIAMLHGHVAGSLGASTGVETSRDVAAYLLAGADAVMTASALMRHGIGWATVILDGLDAWLRSHRVTSLDDIRGRLAVPRDADTSEYERAGYVAAMRRGRAMWAAAGMRWD